MYLKINSYFSTKTFVVGTQKNRLNDHPQHMILQVVKKLIKILLPKRLFMWVYASIVFLKFRSTFLFLFSNKMLDILVGIYKMLVRMANMEDPDQTDSSEAV